MYRLTSPASNVQPSYTVCATDTVNVVTSFQDTRTLEPMRWVPIPTLVSKPLKDLMRLPTSSARVETATTKAVLPRSVQANSLPHPRVRLLGNGRTATASPFANAGSRLLQQSIGPAEAVQGTLVRTTA